MKEITDDMIVKHYGLIIGDEWFTNRDGIIFAVTCPRVAQVELEIIKKLEPDLFTRFTPVVKEIIPSDPTIGLE